MDKESSRGKTITTRLKEISIVRLGYGKYSWLVRVFNVTVLINFDNLFQPCPHALTDLVTNAYNLVLATMKVTIEVFGELVHETRFQIILLKT